MRRNSSKCQSTMYSTWCNRWSAYDSLTFYRGTALCRRS